MENVTGKYDIYKDIYERTGGELYLGVVGPVRTGKSTFIKQFMNKMIIPKIDDENERKRTLDELPQSAQGKTIMTTEPKFIPKNGMSITVEDGVDMKIRLIDCVGYVVKDAEGYMEDGAKRMVKTPWSDEEIPFENAAEIGTNRVINDHSNVGIIITTDGSFGEIDRESYIEAEQKTIMQMKSIGKPFIVLLNSVHPHSDKTVELADKISGDYNVNVYRVNCEQLKREDALSILKSILDEFPLCEINFTLPKWFDILDVSHWLKSDIVSCMKNCCMKFSKMNDVNDSSLISDSPYIKNIMIVNKDTSTGIVNVNIELHEHNYYNILSEMTGTDIQDEYMLIDSLKKSALMKDSYEKVNQAMSDVERTGYGVVAPVRDEIVLEEPEIIKNGSRYGIKIKATAPSVHMIKTDIVTEIAPIVGSEQQAQDLIDYINSNSGDNNDGIWETNIFGKSVEQIVWDGIDTKIAGLTDETRQKMQNAVMKITNENKGNVIFIIL